MKRHKIVRLLWTPGLPGWMNEDEFMAEMKYEGVDRVMSLRSIAEVLQCTVDSVDRVIYKMMEGDADA